MQNSQCNCSNTTLDNVWFDCWITKESKRLQSCTYNYKQNFFKLHVDKICSQYCPVECDSIKYSVAINDYDDISIKESYKTRVEIYFKSLQHIFIKQKPKQHIPELISKIGGVLGLFTGLSLVSLFELTVILIEVGIVCFKKLRNSKKRRKNSNDESKEILDMFNQIQQLNLRYNKIEKNISELTNLLKKEI